MHASVLDTSSHRQQSMQAQAVPDHTVSFLDSAIPLKDASHGDVVRYSVETIWRKAECVATLADGRTVKLLDSWQFIGYTGRRPVRRLLFRHNGAHFEVRIDGEDLVVAVEEINASFALRKMLGQIKSTLVRALDSSRIYTSVDGSQVSPAG